MNSSNQLIYSLVADVAKSIVSSSIFEDEFLDDVTPALVSILSGKKFSANKQDYRASVIKHLSKIAYFKSAFITKNSLMLAKSFGLDEQAHKLITFVIAISLSPSLRTLIEITTGFSESRIFDLVEEITAIETTKLEHYKQELLKSGLFSFSDYNDMSDLFDMNKQLACVLVSEELSNHDELLSHILFPSSKCLLKQSDFKHMDLFSLKHFITNAKKRGDKGINILIYGAPGTGKSQFAKLIAEATRLKLFEVKAIGDDLYKFQSEVYSGEPSSKLRLQYLKLINRVMDKNTQSVLLIDECEDIFSNFEFNSRISKETLHNILEQNQTPTIWITNNIDEIEESCIRRFSYVLKMPELNNETKVRIAKKYYRGLGITNSFINEMVNHDGIQASHFEQSAKYARTIGYEDSDAESAISHHIKQTLTALGFSTNKAVYKSTLEFNLDYLNVKPSGDSIAQVINAVRDFNSSRTLISGPSGTGKTALVNYICSELNLNLIQVKTSDVLSKWVGDNERNIARIFNKAREVGAALFFDEVDSLLTNRESLNNHWEHSMVNEFLQHIEQFELPLFAATNFAESLDKAVARRFDFKVELDYLKEVQVRELYKHVMRKSELTDIEVAKLKGLKKLSAGEFSVLYRKYKFGGKYCITAFNKIFSIK